MVQKLISTTRSLADLEAENAGLRAALERAALRQVRDSDDLAEMRAAAEADHQAIETLRETLASAHAEAKASLEALLEGTAELALAQAETGAALAGLAAGETKLRFARDEATVAMATRVANAAVLERSRSETRAGLAALLASEAALRLSEKETEIGAAALLAGAAALSLSEIKMNAGQADLLVSMRLNEAQSVANTLLSTIVEAVPGMIYAKDRDRRLILANRMARERLGKRRDELQGRIIQDLLASPADAQTTVTDDRRVIEEGAFGEFEELVSGDVDQSTSWLVAQAPLRAADATVFGLVGMSIDITEHKSIEARLRHRERLEAAGRLTAGVAHDFNNVLQAMLSCIELAKDDVADRPDAMANLETALRAGRRGARLTSHLLSSSRQQVLRPAPLAVSTLLSENAALLTRTLGHKITVSLDIVPDLPLILADGPHLDAVFLNLALNARDAMPQGGHLRIEARAEGELIMIAFADTGEGMTPEVLELACDPFFTTKGLAGSGLGLAMAEGFARQSGGDLRIESTPGKGTRVTIALPVIRNVNTAVPTIEVPHTDGHGRVLVVDDDADTARVTGALLRKAGFDVTTVSGSDQGLLELRFGQAFDALVTDYAMSGMDGVDLVVCARELYPMLPALVITGYVGADGLGRLPLGVKVLHKPFQRGELVRVVTEMAQTSALKSPP